MKLIRLPNGDWIDAEYITMIEAAEEIDMEDDDECICEAGDVCDCGCRDYIPPRVIFQITGGDRRWIECNSIEEACTMRDEMAAQVNEARQ